MPLLAVRTIPALPAPGALAGGGGPERCEGFRLAAVPCRHTDLTSAFSCSAPSTGSAPPMLAMLGAVYVHYSWSSKHFT